MEAREERSKGARSEGTMERGIEGSEETKELGSIGARGTKGAKDKKERGDQGDRWSNGGRETGSEGLN